MKEKWKKKSHIQFNPYLLLIVWNFTMHCLKKRRLKNKKIEIVKAILRK